jgi:hypothetical protein
MPKTLVTFGSFLAAKDLRAYLTWSAAYALVAHFTGAYFMADTVNFVADVYNYQLGIRDRLWEFGHLFWRPLGWIFLQICEVLVGSVTGPELNVLLTRIFVALNWFAGLACILLLRAVLRQFSIRPMVVTCTTAALLFSNAFLNYIHSGSSYIPGLAFLLAAFYLLALQIETRGSILQPFSAALMLAIAVCLWFPYIFAVPGVLAIPLFRHYGNPSRWAFTIRVASCTLILGLVFYGSVLVCNGLFNVHDIYQWVTAESRAVGGVGGPARAIFGVARSFINMGNDGVFFKRFLLHDPYNPVSFFDLLRLSFVKFLLFYSVLVLVFSRLVSNPRIFWMCLVTAIPVLAFAVFWHGGDTERYLPLYPVFFVGLAHFVDDNRTPVYFKWLAGTLLLVSIVSNCGATSSFLLDREQRQAEERIKDVLPLLKPHSRLVLVDIHDELENFGRSFPFDPVVRGQMLRTYPVLNPGTVQTLHWRQDLMSVVLNVWMSHGDIWVSGRILEPRPHRDWNWVEGDDPRVTWSMVHSFFTQLDYSRSVGNGDGFLLLPPTAKNEAIIRSLWDGKAAVKF